MESLHRPSPTHHVWFSYLISFLVLVWIDSVGGCVFVCLCDVLDGDIWWLLTPSLSMILCCSDGHELLSPSREIDYTHTCMRTRTHAHTHIGNTLVCKPSFYSFASVWLTHNNVILSLRLQLNKYIYAFTRMHDLAHTRTHIHTDTHIHIRTTLKLIHPFCGVSWHM